MSAKYEKIHTATSVATSDELPEQLFIDGSEIKTRSGCTPLFPSFAEGDAVTVVLRSEAVRLMDELNRLRKENFKLRLEAAVERSYSTVAAESVPEPSYSLPKTYDEWCGCKQAAPKFRAWTTDEVPLGAEVRNKLRCHRNGSRSIIAGVTDGGEVLSLGFNPEHEGFGKRGFSTEKLRQLFEWRPNSSYAQWRNCEVEI